MNIDQIKEKAREVYLLSHTSALLGWDQETYMPPMAIEERGDQQALIQGLIHDRMTADGLVENIESLESTSIGSLDRALLAKIKRDAQRQMKLPRDLVMKIAKAVSASQAAWVKARENDDYAAFSPHLDQLLALTREKAEAIGYDKHPYDALVDEYEQGMTTEILDTVLIEHGEDLKPFIDEITSLPAPSDSFLKKHYSPERQEQFSRFLLQELGYPMDRGRLDVTAHPFTTTLGADDVRITTRYLPELITSSIFGTIHEAGHGFYELGFDENIRGNLLAEGASLGIHESQSRMWENIIGRSREFWVRYYPELQKLFPDNLSDVGCEDFFRGVNKVSKSFIRVEADEVTYNLHIILRYRLEKSMIRGDLTAADLPHAWNEAFKSYFGLTPPSNRVGLLQDIHWSMGAFGYFPTYALGNLYAAQFAEAMDTAIGGIAEAVDAGEFSRILKWLGGNIHARGAADTPAKILKDITGSVLSARPYMNYLKNKYTMLYTS